MKNLTTTPGCVRQGSAKAVPKKQLSPFIRNLVIACVLLALVIIAITVYYIFKPDENTNKHHMFDIQMISELTTLQCRYHNVAVHRQEGGFLDGMYQYVWFEYDVLIDVGIDLNQARIEQPTEDGVVKVYLPPAKILGAKDDKESISKPVCEVGWLTEITAEDERSIINNATQKLVEDAKTQEIVAQAYNSAKNVLEQYIINVGKLMGADYTVEWIENPNS